MKGLMREGGSMALLRSSGFTIFTTFLANMPRTLVIIYAGNALNKEGDFIRFALSFGAGMTAFYPLELIRLRLMLDC